MSDVLRSSTNALEPPQCADGPPPKLEEPPTEGKVQLNSSDGREFSVNIAAAKVSKTLADMLTAMGEEGQQAELAVTIDLQVEGDMLEAVLEWCQRYQDLPQDLQPELDPYTRRYRPLELTPWQRTFLNNHLADLWRLAIAVNYLDVASLYNAVCFFIGDLIAKEATPGRIANGQAVGSLKAMFDPNHGQSARTTRTAGRTKEQDTTTRIPFDDAVPADVLVDVFRFLDYDQLQASRRVLPAWADVVASKERFLPREPLSSATLSGNGGIAITSYSIKPGAPPGRMTRSRAQLGEKALIATCMGTQNLYRLEDLWRYAVPELLVFEFTANAMKVIQEYVDEAVDSIRIKGIRVADMSEAAQDVDEFVSRMELLRTFIEKLGGLQHLTLLISSRQQAEALIAKPELLPENVELLTLKPDFNIRDLDVDELYTFLLNLYSVQKESIKLTVMRRCPGMAFVERVYHAFQADPRAFEATMLCDSAEDVMGDMDKFAAQRDMQLVDNKFVAGNARYSVEYVKRRSDGSSLSVTAEKTEIRFLMTAPTKA